MEREVKLINLTYPEVVERLKRNPMVVLPAGSVEQHGRHLPYGTDTFAVELVTEKVARGLDALMIPVTPLGVTPFHMSFTGTITLSPQTYMTLLTEVCESMIKHGVRNFVFVNWHEGNNAPIDLVASKLQLDHPVNCVVVQAAYVAKALYGQEVGLTHGGLLEILPILIHDPELVKLELATDPSDPSQAGKMDTLRRQHDIYTIVNDVREISPTGWHGVVEGASIDRAEEFMQGLTDHIIERVKEAFEALEAARTYDR